MHGDDDLRFLTDRRRRNRLGRPAVALALIGWVGAAAFLVVRFPLLANPLHVLRRLQHNDLGPDVLSLLAALAPLLCSMVLLLVFVLLVFVWSWARMERRYLRIIDRLGGAQQPPGEAAGRGL